MPTITKHAEEFLKEIVSEGTAESNRLAAQKTIGLQRELEAAASELDKKFSEQFAAGVSPSEIMENLMDAYDSKERLEERIDSVVPTRTDAMMYAVQIACQELASIQGFLDEEGSHFVVKFPKASESHEKAVSLEQIGNQETRRAAVSFFVNGVLQSDWSGKNLTTAVSNMYNYLPSAWPTRESMADEVVFGKNGNQSYVQKAGVSDSFSNCVAHMYFIDILGKDDTVQVLRGGKNMLEFRMENDIVEATGPDGERTTYETTPFPSAS